MMTTTASRSAASAPTRAGWATFLIDGEHFALRVEDVQEVLMNQPLARVPLAPPHIVGLLNLRGQVMPALDMRQCLGLTPAREARAILVLSRGRGGLVVDEIGDVITVDQAEWRNVPETLHQRYRDLIHAVYPVEGGLVLAVRLDAMVSENIEREGSRS